MIAFVIAVLFGIGEMFLLNKLLVAATSGKYKDLSVFLAVKFLTYTAAILLLVFVFRNQLIHSLCGFAVGMPCFSIAFFIYKSKNHKKMLK